MVTLFSRKRFWNRFHLIYLILVVYVQNVNTNFNFFITFCIFSHSSPMKYNNHCSPNRPDCRDNICTIDLREKALQNHNYRETVWTGCFMQMTVMCIPACSDVGLEIHDNTDQIIRIEQGTTSSTLAIIH